MKTFKLMILMICLVRPVMAAPVIIDGISTTEKVVAITVEGIDSASALDKLVAVCQQCHVRITLFMPSLCMANNRADIHRIAQRRFEFGEYGVKEQSWDELRVEDIRKEILASNRIIRKTTGMIPKVIKPVRKYYTADFIEAVRSSGLAVHIVRGHDVLPSNASHGGRIVLHAIRAGDVVNLMYNAQTTVLLPEVIRTIRQYGFKVITVSELLSLAAKR